jgi:hypothetical protein
MVYGIRQHLYCSRQTRLTFNVIIARMAAWTAVAVPRKSYDFPALCPDCLRTGPLTAVPIPANLPIKVPFCELCTARLVKWRKLGRPLLILSVVIAFAVTLWFDLSKWVGCWLAIVLVLPTVWLTDYRDRVVRIKNYDANKVTVRPSKQDFLRRCRKVKGLR